MVWINNSNSERNRGIELLLYREEEKKRNKSLKKFNLKKTFSCFRWQFNIQIEFDIKKKSNLSGEKKC